MSTPLGPGRAGLSDEDALPSLCIGMATYDDFDGAWFTLQSIRMYHPEVLPHLSFVVIDNDPSGASAEPLAALADWIPEYRYVPFAGYSGTSVRDLVFRETEADVVCCVDSHVLIRPGGLAALMAWFAAHPESPDLLQGPLWNDDLTSCSSHMTPTWGAGMYGQWGLDERAADPDADPFEIEMHGLGLFACRREAWPGINPRLRGFGAEEGYLHERFRRAGGRTLCHPRLGWLHRFGRPRGIRYPIEIIDRVRNYVVAWSELGWDLAPARAHFADWLGPEVARAALAQATEQLDDPLGRFDGVFAVGGAEAEPELAWRAETVGGDPVSGCLTALASAAHREYESVLIIGGAGRVPRGRARRDETAPRMLCPGALAVPAAAFERMLADLCETGARAASWRDIVAYVEAGLDPQALRSAALAMSGDRPALAPGVELTELEEGMLARVGGDAGRTHTLNNTAAMILCLSDGTRSVAEIAAELAGVFAAERPPLGEVAALVRRLREDAVLVTDPTCSVPVPG